MLLHRIDMPPNTRPLTTRLRSLHSPQVTLQSQTLCRFVRPQCVPVLRSGATPVATGLAQRRSLHLYKTAKAKTALGMHKVLDFKEYDLEPLSASDLKVNLVESDKCNTIIAKDLSLQELHDKYVSPGKFLYMADPVNKKDADDFEALRAMDSTSQKPNFAIGTVRTVLHNIKNPQPDRKQLGGLKSVNLLLSNPISYTRLALDRAYQFIDAGSPVEFRIRLVGPLMVKKFKGILPDEAVPWIQEHFPHLRHDFITKSMPEGTQYLITPFSDGKIIQFVLSVPAEQMPKLDLTTRLRRVSQAVTNSLDKNTMAQNYLAKQERKLREMRPASEIAETKAEREKRVHRGEKRRLTIRVDRSPEEQFAYRQKKRQENADSQLRQYQEASTEGPRSQDAPKHRWEHRGQRKTRSKSE